MFYDNFIFLCREHGISPTRLLTKLGISKGSLSRWKDGGEPLNETKKKIADYFGITVTELTVEEETKKSAPARTEAEADDELKAILQDFKDNPELRTLFSLSRKATPEEARQYADVIRALRGDR